MARTLMDIAGRCDGVRCDMAMLVVREKFLELWGGEFDHPDAEFWEEAIPRVKEKYPDFLFLAEVYWWGMDYLLQQQGFDYTYDKILYDHLRSNRIYDLQTHLKTSPDYQCRMARFIENHDEERAMATFGQESQGGHRPGLDASRAAIAPRGPDGGPSDKNTSPAQTTAARGERRRAGSFLPLAVEKLAPGDLPRGLVAETRTAGSMAWK